MPQEACLRKRYIKYAIRQLLKNGVDRERLLLTPNGILSDEELDAMSEWDDLEVAVMQEWLNKLEKMKVYFSAPLDIDLLMLESFSDEYKMTLSDKEGPRIRVFDGAQSTQVNISVIELKEPSRPEYDDRIKKDISLTLKEHGGLGATYTLEQKKLMVWYNYFFLNRGKPSTHIAALATIDEETLRNSMPPVLRRLCNVSKKMLKDEINEDNPA